MSIDKIITFEQDTAERKRWFSAASFSHPAKMHLSLQIYLIEHYTKKGDTILDPMTGSGTILVACALERNVICVELEKKFCDMQKDNWDKIKSLGPMLGYKMGEAVILQGDARNLDNLLVDKCIFSPPYSNEHSSGLSEKTIKEAEKIHKRKYTRHSFTGGEDYGSDPDNISNLPYGEISAVISSPPYAEAQISVSKQTSKLFNGRKLIKDGLNPQPQNPNNIGNLPYKADAVITSPPYEHQVHKNSDFDKVEQIKAISPSHYVEHSQPVAAAQYNPCAENIGNLKSENYLEAMLTVYRQCYKVLKPKGLFILVTKNFIREKKIVRLDSDTIKLCEQAGFVLIERLKRKLTQMSFWRRIYQQKYPDAPTIDFEDVLIFEREGQ